MAYGSAANVRARGNSAVAVVGFEELQRALRRIEDGVEPQWKARVKAIGEAVAKAAAANVTHNTGRHGGSGMLLEDSIKVSAGLRSASVYSTAVHGGAQNVGAWMGPNRGPHISRGKASHYMDKAVREESEFVTKEVEGLLDWLETVFSGG